MPRVGGVTEMCGGQGWGPGEWTDDTQMALLAAASLLDRNGLDEADLFDRFVRWVRAGPKDVGNQTRDVLTSGDGWEDAAQRHFAVGNRAAGNGSLMRTTPAAIYFARSGPPASAAAARRTSGLTHGDPAAGDGCAIYHRLVAAALEGVHPLGALPDALADVPEPRREKWAVVLADGWDPERATEANGAVWPTLGSAVWALRRFDTFEDALRAVVNLGGDTDTIAAVTGGLLGAVYGIDAIPVRWAMAVHGDLPGHQPVARGLADLRQLALQLDDGARRADKRRNT